jgi:hypothetical protein
MICSAARRVRAICESSYEHINVLFRSDSTFQISLPTMPVSIQWTVSVWQCTGLQSRPFQTDKPVPPSILMSVCICRALSLTAASSSWVDCSFIFRIQIVLFSQTACRGGEDVLFGWLAPSATPALSLGKLVEAARDRHKHAHKRIVHLRIHPHDANTAPVPLEQWAAWVAAAGGEACARFLGTKWGGVRPILCDRWLPGRQRSALRIDGPTGRPVGSVDAVLDAPRGQGQMRLKQDSVIAFEAKLTPKPLSGDSHYARSHFVGKQLWGLGRVLRAGRTAVERRGDAAGEAALLLKRADFAQLCVVEVDGRDPVRGRWHAVTVPAGDLSDAVGEMPDLEEDEDDEGGEDVWCR